MQNHLINDQIREKVVRVISNDGQQLGVKNINEALKLANEKNLDLVKVSDGDPPVCKLMNYNKFKYEQKKKLKEQQKNQTIIEGKEIQIHTTTDKGDLLTKARQLEKFLLKGNHVNITLRLRGREANKAHYGVEAMNDFLYFLNENNIKYKIKKPVNLNGRIVMCSIMP